MQDLFQYDEKSRTEMWISYCISLQSVKGSPLELFSDLRTVFKISERSSLEGSPKKIYSDNGIEFVLNSTLLGIPIPILTPNNLMFGQIGVNLEDDNLKC